MTLKDGESPAAVSGDHARKHGATVNHVYEHALRGYAARMSESAAARVARPDVDVAVIDTGIDSGHPDLVITGGKNCVHSGSTDDGNGHGTHVAGTIGAIDNEIGILGVAPGARLWPVRVLDNRSSGTWSQVACGIDYVSASAEHIEVANMSLGGGGSEKGCADNGLPQAICAAVSAGVTFVVAAGNDAADAAGFVSAAYDQVITVPALADSDGAAAGTWSPTACRSDQEDSLTDLSNYGGDVDLIAPGVCIRSTWKDGGYSTVSGTSMAHGGPGVPPEPRHQELGEEPEGPGRLAEARAGAAA